MEKKIFKKGLVLWDGGSTYIKLVHQLWYEEKINIIFKIFNIRKNFKMNN